MSLADVARWYLARGWKPLPLSPGSKACQIVGWEHLDIPPEALDTMFPDGWNIGARLGHGSGNLLDTDFDHDLARRLAPAFLPPEILYGATFGRASKMLSHALVYALPGETVRRVTFKDVDGITLAEVRGNGCQTMMPGSIHPSGEPVQWISANDPPRLSADNTIGYVAWTSAATMLARGWKLWQGQHHDICLHLTGALLRGGIPSQSIEFFISKIIEVGGDHEPEDRILAIRTTISKFAAGEATTGFPSLAEHIGWDRCRKLIQWLRLTPTMDAFTFTDDGNALRFVTIHTANIKFCHDLNSWLIWDGTRHRPDKDETIVGMARTLPRELMREALTMPEDQAKAQIKWATRTMGADKIAAMLKLARTDDRITVPSDILDADAYKFNVQNGTLNLLTGALEPHSREDLITKISPVPWIVGAQCPIWDRYIYEVFAGNIRVIRFVQKIAGMALTADRREQVFVVVYGPQGTGKTTFINVLRAIMGEYVVNVEPKHFMEQRHTSRANPEIAQMQHARLVTTSETNQSERLATGLVKRLSGSSRITAAHLYAPPIEFESKVLIIMDTNYKPRIPATDDAVWARILPIPFEVQFRHTDHHIQDIDKLIIERELPGVLQWCVEGALLWQAERLERPPEIIGAITEYQAENDTLGMFIDERCVVAADQHIPSSALYRAYEDWCHAANERPFNVRGFAGQLEHKRIGDVVIERTRTASGYVWDGIGLIAGIVTDGEFKQFTPFTPAAQRGA